MFNYPATEVFNSNGDRRVVWSAEEFEDAIGRGWSEDRPIAEAAAAPPVPASPAAAPEKPAKPARQ